MIDKSFRIKICRYIARLDWIRLTIRQRIIKYLIRLRPLHSYDFEIDLFGIKYKGNINNYIDHMIYFYGAYEKQELFLMRDILKTEKNTVFIDVGANVGQHSIILSQFCDNVYSFEPLKSVRDKFRTTIENNKIKNIKIYDVGLGLKDEILRFYAPKKDSYNLATGSFLIDHEVDGNEFHGELKVQNGDKFISHLKLENINLIKIDVEGYEKFVLMGLENTINAHKPNIFMEFSKSCKETFANADEFKSLFPKNYKFYKVTANRNWFIFFNLSSTNISPFNFEDDYDVNLLIKPN